MYRPIPTENDPRVPLNRIILLGASNLTLSLRLVIELMQTRVNSPSDILVAAGHGRSYGQFSQVLVRGLPGITKCGLWRQLELEETQQTYAFLTDIGNDIPYENSPAKILAWVGKCVDRLQKHSAQIVMTNVPVVSIENLTERRYLFLRNILYPFCRLSKSEVVENAYLVYQGLIEMSATKQFVLCEQEPDWFGSDGIHVKYWKRKAFYRQFIQKFLSEGIEQQSNEDKKYCASSWKQRPRYAYKTIFGKPIYCQQPSGRLVDNTTISLY